MSTFTYDPYDSTIIHDPFRIYSHLREEHPVYYNDAKNFWALSRYQDIVNVLNDPQRFKNAYGSTLEDDGAGSPMLISQDPPTHTEAKRQIIKFFSRDRAHELEAFIRQQVSSLLKDAHDRHGSDGTWDAFREFCLVLPFSVIANVLDIPETLHNEIIDLSRLVLRRDGTENTAQRDNLHNQILRIYINLVAERRRHLGDDPISVLIQSNTMTDIEIAIRFYETTFAGHDTTAKSLANALLLLHEFPDQKRRLVRDPSLLYRAVEEIFRFDPPSHTLRRTPIVDVPVGGVTIPAGSRVLLILASAARDPEVFSHPNEFDIGREPDRYSVFFGHGIHKCLGAHLARLELAIVIEELLRSFPDYEIATHDVTRSAYANVRGVDTLPMRLGARSRSHA